MKFAPVVAMLAAVFAVAAPAPARAADWTVGANIGNVPWEFQDKQGNVVGFEIDLVKEVAKRAGKTVQIENIPFNGLFSAVQSGRVQIGVSSITVTPKRLASMAFSQPYFDSDQSIAVLKNSKIRSLSDIAGTTIGVDTASTGDIWLTQNGAAYKVGSVSRYEGLAPAMLDLATGRIDAYLSDVPAVAYYIKDKPQYRIASRIPTGERYAFMHAKTFADADRLDAGLSQLKKEGFVAQTYLKWFGSLPPADSSTVTVMSVPKP